MSKLVIIGIDGLDPYLLEKWLDELPHLKSIKRDGVLCKIESTFPADSICAWTSIFTGENPAEHGFIESIDYLAPNNIISSINRRASLEGKTFWDIASQKGKSVCVLNPFLAYPSWEVNGIMVSGPTFESGDISAFPKSILSDYRFPSLGAITDLPDTKDLGNFITRTKNLTIQLGDIGLKLYKDCNPDLFFITFLTLDRMKHFLWRFTDRSDPYYPGRNPFENSVKDFYLMLDGIIGKFINLIGEDTVLLVISDHGHRRRPLNCLNLNEFFRKKGYIVTNEKGVYGFFRKALEKIKVFTIYILARYNLQDYLYKLAKLIPNRKSIKKSTYIINKNKSTLALSAMCGTSPLGGFDVLANNKEEYDLICKNVIRELESINDLLGKRIVKWTTQRKQVYQGKYEDRLPDIFFELDEEYGVGMNFFVPIVSPDYGHKKISGGHKKEAVWGILPKPDSDPTIPLNIMGIKDFVINLLTGKN